MSNTINNVVDACKFTKLVHSKRYSEKDLGWILSKIEDRIASSSGTARSLTLPSYVHIGDTKLVKTDQRICLLFKKTERKAACENLKWLVNELVFRGFTVSIEHTPPFACIEWLNVYISWNCE